MTDIATIGYADAYPLYRDRGWAPIKLGSHTKYPPPPGFTGRDGANPSGADMHAWAEEEPNGNNAIRLPAVMIGIDVDAYDGKTGAETLVEAERRWGRLPYSPRSSSRDDGISGIRLYRIPAGLELEDKLGFPELGLGGVEIVQRHHRYVVCWPSIHPEGRQYRWLGIDGGRLGEPPHLDDIPPLPDTWIEGLRKPVNQHNGTEYGADSPYNVNDAITEGDLSPRVARQLAEALTDLHSGACRHDTTRDHVLALLRYGKQRDTGVRQAMQALGEAFVNRVASNRAAGRDEAIGEFNKMVNGPKVSKLLAEPDNETYGPAFTIDPPGAGAQDDEPPDTEPKFVKLLLTRDALKQLPKPDPLIDNLLDQGTVALLYGRWGTCKTFIAIDWAACVATSRAWQGRTTGQRRVLYVAAEGAFGISTRVDAWEAGWRTQIGDGDLQILPRPVNLTNAADVSELAALIRWGGYGFVILDTLARCMVGADENSAKDCGLVVDALTRLREHTPGGRGVVLAVHHTGKDGKTFRGSSVFEAGADTVYAVTADGGVITLDREKRKDGPQLDRHELRLELIEGTESGVISAHRWGGQTDRADKLMGIFDHQFAHTGATKAEFRTAAVDAGISSMTYYRGVHDLLESGALVNTGTDKRPFYVKGGK